MEFDITEITVDNRNEYFGIYKKNNSDNYLYCLVDDRDPNNILLINLLEKYYIIINVNTTLPDNKYYMSHHIFNIDSKSKIFPDEISQYIRNSTMQGSIKHCQIIKNTEGVITIKFRISGNNKIITKNEKYSDIESLIRGNREIKETRGGTRAVLLLDKIVLKYTDPTCDIKCEQMTNYYAKSFGINVSELIGIVTFKGQKMIVEKKYDFIDWIDCLRDINFYKEYKEKFNKLVQNINEKTVLGDYNLSNILLDNKTNDLIITDFNGTLPDKFLRKGMISSIDNANNFITRLLDYITDPRKSASYGVKKFNNREERLAFKNLLSYIFRNYDKLLETRNKYLKYKIKYNNLKNN